MSCTTCGSPDARPGQFCTHCGSRQPDAMPRYTQLPYIPRVPQHLERLAILWAVFAVYRVLASIAGMFFLHTFFSGYGPWGWRPHHMPFHGLMHFSITAMLVIGAGNALVAYGLMQRQSWARPLALVFSIFALFHFPLGTALGIYTLWVLAPAASGAEYEAIAEG